MRLLTEASVGITALQYRYCETSGCVGWLPVVFLHEDGDDPQQPQGDGVVRLVEGGRLIIPNISSVHDFSNDT
jgi:hypothetical protein